MGIIFSRLKKKECTKEKLCKIQEEIGRLEEYKECTEQRRKKLVGSLVIYSFLLCIFASIIFYLYYFPPTLKERLLYGTPFIGFIILIYLIKKTLTWYYRWKVNQNEKSLSTLKAQKAAILNQVMETETYKVAKEILEMYAPELLLKNQASKTFLSSPRIVDGNKAIISSGEVRHRTLATPVSNTSSGIKSSVSPATMPLSTRSSFASRVPAGQGFMTKFTPSSLPSQQPHQGVPPGPPMPRPILPRERGMLDRFVEYLVGDGPSNRYALVCRQCESHNGMALKDEFPYIAFRCAYCYYWNPARKQKPPPPRLETLSTEHFNKEFLSELDVAEEEDKKDEKKSVESEAGSESSDSCDEEIVEELPIRTPLSEDTLEEDKGSTHSESVHDGDATKETDISFPKDNESIDPQVKDISDSGSADGDREKPSSD